MRKAAPSSTGTEVHVVRRVDVERDAAPQWIDPDGIAVLSETRRAALLANPLAGDAKEPLQLIGTQHGRVIGRMDVVAGRIETAADGPAPIFWGSAFQVPEAHRSTLMGVKLVLTMQRRFEVVGASGPSQLATPVYEGLKYLDLPLRRFVLVRRTRPILERYLGTGPALRPAAALADVVLAPHSLLLAAWRAIRARGFLADRVAAFPRELESRLAEAAPPARMHRSASWFDWLLAHSFAEGERHRRALYLVRDRRGDVVAYFLVKSRVYRAATQREFPFLALGALHDWQVFEPRAIAFDQVAVLAIAELLRWRVDAAEVCVPADVSFDPRRLGLVPAGRQHVFVRAGRDSVLSSPEYASPSAWRARPGEGDYTLS